MTRVIQATIDSDIRLDLRSIPRDVLDGICVALRVKNPHKEVAEREMLWSARHIPDTIDLFDIDEHELILPLGFRHAFERGLEAHGISVQWSDDRRWYDANLLAGLMSIELRNYQEPMCEALLAAECATAEAPTGAGKTEIVLEAIRRAGQPALIIVDRSALAQQWVERIRDRLGAEAGFIGGGEIRTAPITVALRQTLHERRHELQKTRVEVGRIMHRHFFDVWGTVVLDEHHHASAPTVTELLQRFPARYRWGVSATPERDPLMAPIVKAIIGPIVYAVSVKDAAEHLVKPSVRVLESSFTFDYHPTQRVQDTRTGAWFVARNNYTSMMKALCSDEDRNAMIASAVAQEALQGHHVLVVSRQKGHLSALCAALSREDPLLRHFMLTGQDKAHRAAEIAREIADCDSGTVLFSSVADEGLDIPRLDRVVLAFPGRNPEVFKQQIGRIMRPFAGKSDALVIDVRDGQQSLLRSQFKSRADMLYAREGLEVQRMEFAR